MIVAVLLALCGCASVIRGSHAPYHIVSTPTGAQVQLSTGETCVTPCTLDLPRAAGFIARIMLPGHYTQLVAVESRGNAGGVMAAIGNGLIGGVAGLGADSATGATRSLSPNPLVVKLAPLEPAADQSPAARSCRPGERCSKTPPGV